GAGHPGVRADRLDADPANITLEGEELGELLAGPGGVPVVQVRGRVVVPLGPAGLEDDPRAGGDAAMTALPGLRVLDGDEVVGVPGDLVTHVDHDGGADEVLRRNLVQAGEVAAGGPVAGRVEVRARVLAKVEREPR